MTDVSRRGLLFGSIASIPLTYSLLTGGVKQLKNEDVRLYAQSEEFKAVLKAWLAREKTPPRAYLLSRLGNEDVDTDTSVLLSKVRTEVTLDFAEGELFEVEGLILSKVEAATIAVLAEAA